MSRDKQIEEIAKAVKIAHDEQRYLTSDRSINKIAEHLYNAGYRKASDLEAEIADLNAIAEQYRKQFEDCYEEKAKLTEENERLKLAPKIGSVSVPEALEILNKYCESGIKKAKADTVRKMQERLKERKVSYCTISFRVVPVDDIDQIAEEMLEELK